MPLRKCASQNCFNRNVSAEVKSGKPVKQAVAIAMSEANMAKKNTKKK